MSEIKRYCVFCGKEMNKWSECHNPDPIRRSDGSEEGYMSCCVECNREYVIPARMALWTGRSGLSDVESRELIAYVNTMNIEDVKRILKEDNATELFKEDYKKSKND